MAAMEHVVLGDDGDDQSESSLQELANAALKSLSEFQIMKVMNTSFFRVSDARMRGSIERVCGTARRA